MLSRTAAVLGLVLFGLFACTAGTCINTSDSFKRPDETSKGFDSSDNDEEMSLECEGAEVERNGCEHEHTKDMSEPQEKQLAGTGPASMIKAAGSAIIGFVSALARRLGQAMLRYCRKFWDVLS